MIEMRMRIPCSETAGQQAKGRFIGLFPQYRVVFIGLFLQNVGPACCRAPRVFLCKRDIIENLKRNRLV